MEFQGVTESMKDSYRSLPKVLTPGPSREQYSAATYRGGGVIEYRKKPSTSTRLHEVGHKLLGHEPGRMNLGKFIDLELDAESFSYEARGKPITHRIALPVLVELVEDWGLSPSEAVNVVTYRLSERGVKVGASSRRELNQFAHGELPSV